MSTRLALALLLVGGCGDDDEGGGHPRDAAADLSAGDLAVADADAGAPDLGAADAAPDFGSFGCLGNEDCANTDRRYCCGNFTRSSCFLEPGPGCRGSNNQFGDVCHGLLECFGPTRFCCPADNPAVSFCSNQFRNGCLAPDCGAGGRQSDSLCNPCVGGWGVCRDGKCYQAPLSCTDGNRDGDETDVDCGGSCGLCYQNQACLVDADCLGHKCVNHVCT